MYVVCPLIVPSDCQRANAGSLDRLSERGRGPKCIPIVDLDQEAIGGGAVQGALSALGQLGPG